MSDWILQNNVCLNVEGGNPKSGHAVVVFCQSRESSCRSRAKVYHHGRRGGGLLAAVTYLLLGPRELAFHLFLLIKQRLVFSTQSRKAFNQLLGKHCDAELSLFSHSAVNTRTKCAKMMCIEIAEEPGFDDAATRLAARKSERWTEARQGLQGRKQWRRPHRA